MYPIVVGVSDEINSFAFLSVYMQSLEGTASLLISFRFIAADIIWVVTLCQIRVRVVFTLNV